MLLSYLLHNLMFSALQIMMKQIKNKDNVVTKKPPPSIPVDIEEKHHRKQFIEFHNITDNACANRMMAIHAHKEKTSTWQGSVYMTEGIGDIH